MGAGNMCARLSRRIPVGSSLTQVKLIRQPAAEAASAEVPKLMEPVDRRCRVTGYSCCDNFCHIPSPIGFKFPYERFLGFANAGNSIETLRKSYKT